MNLKIRTSLYDQIERALLHAGYTISAAMVNQDLAGECMKLSLKLKNARLNQKAEKETNDERQTFRQGT